MILANWHCGLGSRKGTHIFVGSNVKIIQSIFIQFLRNFLYNLTVFRHIPAIL